MSPNLAHNQQLHKAESIFWYCTKSNKHVFMSRKTIRVITSKVSVKHWALAPLSVMSFFPNLSKFVHRQEGRRAAQLRKQGRTKAPCSSLCKHTSKQPLICLIQKSTIVLHSEAHFTERSYANDWGMARKITSTLADVKYPRPSALHKKFGKGNRIPSPTSTQRPNSSVHKPNPRNSSSENCLTLLRM